MKASSIPCSGVPTALLPGLDARPVPGHTPGSTIHVVAGGSERLLLIGDVLHTPAKVNDPGWEAVMDVDSAAAKPRDAAWPLQERSVLLRGAFPAAPVRLPLRGAGRVRR